jgi:hypothetical protein
MPSPAPLYETAPVACDLPVPVGSSPDSSEETERRHARSLREVFASIADPRKRKGRRHPLDSILALVVVSLLAGCKNPSHIHQFGKSHPAWLVRLGFRAPKRPRRKENRGRVRGPNEDTISSVFASISPSVFNEAFAAWAASRLRRSDVAHIDGKALRGAHDHVLSVFVARIGHVVWQETVGTKENELSALERSIGDVLAHYPSIATFTGDAMFCQKTIARAIVAARRNYFFQLKNPHKTDVAIAEDVFAQQMNLPPLATDGGGKRGALTDRSG